MNREFYDTAELEIISLGMKDVLLISETEDEDDHEYEGPIGG